MNFWLGVHRPYWLEQTDVPLMVSRRTLRDRVTLPRARGPWVLDSGGFTELSLHHEWRTTAIEYVHDVCRFASEIGSLEWVAPQDWMCEPFMLERTGLTIAEHQRLTVDNFLALRDALGALVIPVLQGHRLNDYFECWERYERAGVELHREAVVGIGSVCRRQNTPEIARIVRALGGGTGALRLHGFGVKLTGLESYADALASADSMAWSAAARWDANHSVPSCDPRRRRSCANCLPLRTRLVRALRAATPRSGAATTGGGCLTSHSRHDQ